MSRYVSRSLKRTKLVELTPYQEKEIEKAFSEFDTNGSGTIDRHELRVALRAMGFEVSKNEISVLMDEHDPHGNGLDREGFRALCATKMSHRKPDKEIKKSFTLFDANQDGRIDIKDLQIAVREAGLRFDDETTNAMIKEFDPDGKGYINLYDFQEIMNPTKSYY